MSEHEATIYPYGNPENRTFRAACSCGWRGLERWHQSHADADADHHLRWIPGAHAYARDAGHRVDEILSIPRHPVEQG